MHNQYLTEAETPLLFRFQSSLSANVDSFVSKTMRPENTTGGSAMRDLMLFLTTTFTIP